MSLIHMADLLAGVAQLAKAMHDEGIRIDSNISVRAEGYWQGAKEMFEAMAKAQGVTQEGVQSMIQLAEARANILW